MALDKINTAPISRAHSTPVSSGPHLHRLNSAISKIAKNLLNLVADVFKVVTATLAIPFGGTNPYKKKQESTPPPVSSSPTPSPTPAPGVSENSPTTSNAQTPSQQFWSCKLIAPITGLVASLLAVVLSSFTNNQKTIDASGREQQELQRLRQRFFAETPAQTPSNPYALEQTTAPLQEHPVFPAHTMTQELLNRPKSLFAFEDTNFVTPIIENGADRIQSDAKTLAQEISAYNNYPSLFPSSAFGIPSAPNSTPFDRASDLLNDASDAFNQELNNLIGTAHSITSELTDLNPIPSLSSNSFGISSTSSNQPSSSIPTLFLGGLIVSGLWKLFTKGKTSATKNQKHPSAQAPRKANKPTRSEYEANNHQNVNVLKTYNPKQPITPNALSTALEMSQFHGQSDMSFVDPVMVTSEEAKQIVTEASNALRPNPPYVPTPFLPNKVSPPAQPLPDLVDMLPPEEQQFGQLKPAPSPPEETSDPPPPSDMPLPPVTEDTGNLPLPSDMPPPPVTEETGNLPLPSDMPPPPVTEETGNLPLPSDMPLPPVTEETGNLPPPSDMPLPPVTEETGNLPLPSDMPPPPVTEETGELPLPSDMLPAENKLQILGQLSQQLQNALTFAIPSSPPDIHTNNQSEIENYYRIQLEKLTKSQQILSSIQSYLLETDKPTSDAPPAAPPPAPPIDLSKLSSPDDDKPDQSSTSSFQVSDLKKRPPLKHVDQQTKRQQANDGGMVSFLSQAMDSRREHIEGQDNSQGEDDAGSDWD